MAEKNQEQKQKITKTLTGKVAKKSGEKTIKVRVQRKYPHPIYGKIVKDHSNILVHYEGKMEDINIGDQVLIQEDRKVSKKKAWKFVEIIKKEK